MYEFYNRNFWSSKLKFRCYRKKQKAFSEIVKMFTHDSIKYRTGASTNMKTTTRNNNSYSRPPSLDGSVKANKTIIANGDGRFSPTMRGKRPGPTKTIIKAPQKCEENCGVTVQMVDEYLHQSSQQQLKTLYNDHLIHKKKKLCNDQQSEEYILCFSIKKLLVILFGIAI